jgi:hypothetical protein
MHTAEAKVYLALADESSDYKTKSIDRDFHMRDAQWWTFAGTRSRVEGQVSYGPSLEGASAVDLVNQ